MMLWEGQQCLQHPALHLSTWGFQRCGSPGSHLVPCCGCTWVEPVPASAWPRTVVSCGAFLHAYVTLIAGIPPCWEAPGSQLPRWGKKDCWVPKQGLLFCRIQQCHQPALPQTQLTCASLRVLSLAADCRVWPGSLGLSISSVMPGLSFVGTWVVPTSLGFLDAGTCSALERVSSSRVAGGFSLGALVAGWAATVL